MVKIIAVALMVCVVNIVMKQQRPEYAFLISVVSAAILMMSAVPYIGEIADKATAFAEKTGVDNEYILIAIKIIGISLITQAAVEICRDAGEGALAMNLEMTGKVLMLTSALPAVNALFDAIERVLP